MKIARIIPLYKGDNNQLIHNYRPISILPFFSKVFEKIVHKYVVELLDDINISYQYQFGFRKHHSTGHAIITLVERVTQSLDTGKYFVGVFLDLKKAFDTVDHSILLKKLEKYGIRGNMIKWFKSYLSFRLQLVDYDDCHSDKSKLHMEYQGSILGPLLFILYINDFSKVSNLLFSILFADDTSVFIEGTAYSSVIKDMNTELVKVDEWLKSNKLTVNIKQTHYIMFHHTIITNKASDDIVHLCGNNLVSVKNTKFLGVIIDSKLNSSDHIAYIKI